MSTISSLNTSARDTTSQDDSNNTSDNQRKRKAELDEIAGQKRAKQSGGIVDSRFAKEPPSEESIRLAASNKEERLSWSKKTITRRRPRKPGQFRPPRNHLCRRQPRLKAKPYRFDNLIGSVRPVVRRW